MFRKYGKHVYIYNAKDMIIEYVFIAHEYSWIMFIAREQWI